MSGESDERCTAAMRRPKVVGVAKTDMAHGKACRLQAFANELLAAGIFGRDGRAADKVLQEVECRVHGLDFRKAGIV